MAWRTVVISNPARLRVENDQLVIQQQESVALPVEDIGLLMLESPEVLLTSALLDRLAEHGVTLLVCGKRHLPTLAAMPFAGHCRLARVQRLQIELSAPFRKRCWQAVVQRKIVNQARCLEILDRPGAQDIRRMAESVASGDPANVESLAAREHFRRLFGEGFARGDDDAVNHALNYGYAVVRAAVARALTAHGFLPAHGIHHHSELNQFNLADDFVEPFRPVVDLAVAGMLPVDELTKDHRRSLVALLHVEVGMSGARHALLHAAEMTAASFLGACERGEPASLRLPDLLPLKTHAYE